MDVCIRELALEITKVVELALVDVGLVEGD